MKILKILILIFIAVVAGFYFLVNAYFLPEKGRTLIKQQLKTHLNRDIDFDKISYSLIKGIVLENFSVKAKDNLPFKKLIKSQKISFNLLILPYILKHKIIITGLNMEKVELNLLKNKDNQLNISDLLKSIKSKKKLPSFLILSLKFKNATFNYYDYSGPKVSREKLTNTYLAYNYSFPFSLKFKIDAKQGNNGVSLKSKGSYNFRTGNANIGGKIQNLKTAKLVSFVNLPLKLEKTKGKLTTEFISSLHKNKVLYLKTDSKIEDLSISTASLNIKGDIDTDSILQYDLKEKKFLSLNGNLIYKNILIEGVPYIKRIEHLEGKSTFNNEQINFENLQAEVLNSPTTFTGSIKNYHDPYLNLSIKSELNLNKILELFPQQKKGRFQNIKASGQSYAVLKLNGKIKKLISLDIQGDISFSDVSIESGQSISKISHINGKINLSKNRAEITGLTAYFKNTKYTLNGLLENFRSPHIELKILSENLFCNLLMDKQGNAILVKKVEGNYFDNKFNLTGTINNLSSPKFNIYGDITFYLAQLDKVIPSLSKSVRQLEPKGTVTASIHFEGEPRKWRKATAAIKASSDQITLKGFELDNLYLNTAMQDEKIYVTNLSLNPYGGTFNLSGSIDIGKERPIYNAKMTLRELDLKKLTYDTKLRDKDISGLAFLEVNLMSPLKDISGLYGKGTLLITKGHLFEIPFLSKLASAIEMRQAKKTVFKEAYADFTIKNRTISTENLTLISDELSLKSKGNLDFNGNLNFITNAELSKNTYAELGKNAQVASVFFNTLGEYLMRIKITGKITNPKYEKVPISSEEMMKEGLIKGIGDILKGF